MKIKMSNLLLCMVLSWASILSCMQEEKKESQVSKLKTLLADKKKDPQAIADLLWESTDSTDTLRELLDLIHVVDDEQLYAPIAQAVLSHAYDIRPLLLKNISTKYQIAMRAKNLENIKISSNDSYVMGKSSGNKLICRSLEKNSKVGSFEVDLAGADARYLFSRDDNYVIYQAKNAIVRRSLMTNDEVRIPLPDNFQNF